MIPQALQMAAGIGMGALGVPGIGMQAVSAARGIGSLFDRPDSRDQSSQGYAIPNESPAFRPSQAFQSTNDLPQWVADLMKRQG
jgi:hypothetical protein